jgi:AcrR family transcriptional regulator
MNTVDVPNERERLKGETAARIVLTAFEMLRETPTAIFSHEAVAARAGVAARTAYRHFPTQDDLVAAVWQHLRDTTATRWPKSEPDILPYLRELFTQFQENEALTRAMVAAAPRANISTHGSVEGRAAFRLALATRCAGWSDDATNQLVATCVAIYSAPFWLMLRDRGQLPQHLAVEAAVSAMQAVLHSAAGTAPAATPSIRI